MLFPDSASNHGGLLCFRREQRLWEQLSSSGVLHATAMTELCGYGPVDEFDDVPSVLPPRQTMCGERSLRWFWRHSLSIFQRCKQRAAWQFPSYIFPTANSGCSIESGVRDTWPVQGSGADRRFSRFRLPSLPFRR
nr:hypothetical protein Iba_chr01aCG17030 [Ipomoea batatas]